MKVNTKVVFRWDEKEQKYVEIYSEFYEYEGSITKCGGGDTDYAATIFDPMDLYGTQDDKRAAKATAEAQKAASSAQKFQEEMLSRILEYGRPLKEMEEEKQGLYLSALKKALPQLEAYTGAGLSPQTQIAGEDLQKRMMMFGSKTGAVGSATEQYRKGLESMYATEYSNKANILSNLTGLGQGITNPLGQQSIQAMGQAGSNISNLLLSSGLARANLYAGQQTSGEKITKIVGTIGSIIGML